MSVGLVAEQPVYLHSTAQHLSRQVRFRLRHRQRAALLLDTMLDPCSPVDTVLSLCRLCPLGMR